MEYRAVPGPHRNAAGIHYFYTGRVPVSRKLPPAIPFSQPAITMLEIIILDHHFQHTDQVISSFIVRKGNTKILVETGAYATFEHLEAALLKEGYTPADFQQVFLTHIHFDHAGAAWAFAKLGAQIYVHEAGVPHLSRPEKLWNSAAMIYGDRMDSLWGRMEPIPMEQLTALRDGDRVQVGELVIDVLYTPGHAKHHVAYNIEGNIFTGDVGGVKIGKGPVVPPCPPPDINIELWKASVDKILAAAPHTLFLTHFGPVTDIAGHCTALKNILDDWSAFIYPHYKNNTPPAELVPLFVQHTRRQLEAAGLDAQALEQYEYANPAYMSVNGLLRYWKLKEEGRL